MKTKSFIFKMAIIAALFNSCNNNSSKEKEVSISFSGAFALYPLVQKWTEEYSKYILTSGSIYRQEEQAKG